MLVGGRVSEASGASAARQYRRKPRSSARPNLRTPSGSNPLYDPLDHAIAGGRPIFGNAGILAADLNPRTAPHLQAKDVVQGNRLVYSSQVVEAVGPQRSNAQAEINLGEGSDGDRH